MIVPSSIHHLNPELRVMRLVFVNQSSKQTPDTMSATGKSEVVHAVGDDYVLILGGGPVGLMTAAVLAFYDVKSVVLERNSEPTK